MLHNIAKVLSKTLMYLHNKHNLKKYLKVICKAVKLRGEKKKGQWMPLIKIHSVRLKSCQSQWYGKKKVHPHCQKWLSVKDALTKGISEARGQILCSHCGRDDQNFSLQLLLHVKFSSSMKPTSGNPLALPHHRRFISAVVPHLASPSVVLLEVFGGCLSDYDLWCPPAKTSEYCEEMGRKEAWEVVSCRLRTVVSDGDGVGNGAWTIVATAENLPHVSAVASSSGEVNKNTQDKERQWHAVTPQLHVALEILSALSIS